MKKAITVAKVKANVNYLRKLFMSGRLTREEYREEMAKYYNHHNWTEIAFQQISDFPSPSEGNPQSK
jgi:hypothetical protein